MGFFSTFTSFFPHYGKFHFGPRLRQTHSKHISAQRNGYVHGKYGHFSETRAIFQLYFMIKAKHKHNFQVNNDDFTCKFEMIQS